MMGPPEHGYLATSSLILINEGIRDAREVFGYENTSEGKQSAVLTLLNLHANLITSIRSLPHLPLLVTLNLSSNRLKSFELTSPLPSLVCLDLSCNQIILRKFPPTTFLPLLQKLLLPFNQIEDLSALPHLPRLRHLDLRGNLIQDYLPSPISSKLPKLEELHLQQYSMLRNADEEIPPSSFFVQSNPLCASPGYVSSILSLFFPHLISLDGVPIEDMTEWERAGKGGLISIPDATTATPAPLLEGGQPVESDSLVEEEEGEGTAEHFFQSSGGSTQKIEALILPTITGTDGHDLVPRHNKGGKLVVAGEEKEEEEEEAMERDYLLLLRAFTQWKMSQEISSWREKVQKEKEAMVETLQEEHAKAKACMEEAGKSKEREMTALASEVAVLKAEKNLWQRKEAMEENQLKEQRRLLFENQERCRSLQIELEESQLRERRNLQEKEREHDSVLRKFEENAKLKLETLQASYEDLARRTQELSQLHNASNLREQTLRETLSEVCAVMKDQKEKLQSFQNGKTDLEMELQRREEQYSRLLCTSQEQQKMIEALQDESQRQSSAQDREVEALKKALVLVKANYHEAQQQIVLKEKLLEEQSQTLRELKLEKQEMVSKGEEERKRLLKEKRRVEVGNEDLRHELMESQRSWQDQVQKLVQELQRQKDQEGAPKIQEEVEELRRQLAMSQRSVSFLEEELKDAQNRHDQKKEARQRLEALLEEERDRHQEELANMRSKVRSLEEERRQSQEQEKEARDALVSLQHQIREVQNETERLREVALTAQRRYVSAVTQRERDRQNLASKLQSMGQLFSSFASQTTTSGSADIEEESQTSHVR